jgi:hypothetical protein
MLAGVDLRCDGDESQLDVSRQNESKPHHRGQPGVFGVDHPARIVGGRSSKKDPPWTTREGTARRRARPARLLPAPLGISEVHSQTLRTMSSRP